MSIHESHFSRSPLPTSSTNTIHSLSREAPSHRSTKKTPLRIPSWLQSQSDLSCGTAKTYEFPVNRSSDEAASLDTSNSHGQSLYLGPDRSRNVNHLSTPLLSTQNTSIRRRRPLSWFSSTRFRNQDRYHNTLSTISLNSSQLLSATEDPHSGTVPTDVIEKGTISSESTPCLMKPVSVSLQAEKLSFSNFSASSWYTRSVSLFPLSSDRRGKRLSLGYAISSIREKICHVSSISESVPLQLRGLDTLNETVNETVVEDNISRRYAETINLCQEKIQQLTGHGRLKRKLVNNSSGEAGHIIVSSPDAGPMWLREHISDPDQSNSRTQLLLNSPDRRTDLHHGSLTRSRANATGNLNLRTSPESMCKMRLLKSSKSLFSLKTTVSEDKECYSYNNKNVSQKVKEKGHTPEVSLERALRIEASYPVTPTRLYGSKTALYDDGAVPSETSLVHAAGTHPLRMHPNTTAFAQPQSQICGLPTPGSVEAKSSDQEEDEGQGDIDDATLFNEISGDLTYYSRRTPPTPATLSGGRRDDSLATIDTPTQKPGKGRAMVRRGLQKTKTMFNLKDRTRGQGKENVEEEGIKRHAQAEDKICRSSSENKQQIETPPLHRMPHQPITPSPLRQEHEQVTSSPMVLRTAQSGPREEKQRKHRGGYGSLEIFPASPNPKRSSM